MAKTTITSGQSDAAAQLDQTLETFRIAALQDGGREWRLEVEVAENGALALKGGVGPKVKPGA